MPPIHLLLTGTGGLGAIRAGRLLRLIRILRAVRILRMFLFLWRGMDHLSSIMDVKLLKRSLFYGLVAMIFGALLFMTFEQVQVGKNFGSSLWWSFTTLVTGGFADIHNPTSVGGKVLTVMLVIGGMVLVGVFTATLTSVLVRDDDTWQQQDIDEQFRKLSNLEHLVEKIDQRLERLEGKEEKRKTKNRKIYIRTIYVSMWCYISGYEKKDRYLGMFKNLPPSIRFENKRVRFRNEIDWSINHLKKDDRIVWYLSILQRFSMHYLKISNKFSYFEKNHKIGAKIKRKLRGWDIQRVQKDFELFNHETWEHFSNIQMVFGSFKMQHYAFYNKKKNKLEPKSVQEVFDAFRKMESDLQNDNKRDRYCSDGKPVLTFDDGWTWFGISEGFSAQEAAAMRHCGNGEGGRGDYLLSLRQPIEKQGVIFWKPHLTFILNNGYLGEMKGFANQKPHSRYHGYIEIYLLIKSLKVYLEVGIYLRIILVSMI